MTCSQSERCGAYSAPFIGTLLACTACCSVLQEACVRRTTFGELSFDEPQLLKSISVKTTSHQVKQYRTLLLSINYVQQKICNCYLGRSSSLHS